jgi:malate dehydrogenase (oxaloacetate-decarboxylating)
MFTIEEPVVRANTPSAEALRRHALCKGKVQMIPKCGIRSPEDFAIWYTPGVAAPCRAIRANPDLSYEYTNNRKTRQATLLLMREGIIPAESLDE